MNKRWLTAKCCALAGLAALWVATPLASWAAGGVQKMSLAVDGMPRVYALLVPEGATAPMPLVIVFHGQGGDATNAIERGDWAHKAQASGFAVVAPQGSAEHEDRRTSLLVNARSWNAGEMSGSSAQVRGVDDVGFIRALIDELLRNPRLDPSRVYATGMSNGAGMTFRVGLELSDRIAAIAPVANGLLTAPRPLLQPVSLLMIWGTADPLNPIAGGSVKRAGGSVQRPSGSDSWQAWSRLLHCPGEPAVESPANGVTLRAQRGCDGGATAHFITIDGMGHQWPGGQVYARVLAGPGSNALNATDEIWKFFSSFKPRPPGSRSTR